MGLNDYVISNDSSLQDALAMLDRNHRQFLAIVDAEGEFVGTLTDGDVRRGLLRGLSLNTSINECVNVNPIIASVSTSRFDIEEKFKSTKVSAIPVLNERRLVEVVFLEDLSKPQKVNAKVLIMAGGRGERLLPLTQEIPKPLIPIHGVPVIERIIRQFAEQGFHEVWISVHHLSEQIIHRVGDGARFGVTVSYITEDHPLGTAGSLKLMPIEDGHPVLVCNADLFSNVNYRDMYSAHVASGRGATIGVTRHETQIPYGVVNETNDTFESLIEKPTLTHKVAAGVNIFNSNLLNLIPDSTKINIPDFYELININGFEIGVYELRGMWIDIGTLETLEMAKKIESSD